jgi:hypothetical protein
MSTNSRCFSGRLQRHGQTKKKKCKSALTRRALGCWCSIGLIVGATGSMGELADSLPELTI